MPATVLQRYLLNSASLVTSIPASSTNGVFVSTAVVPLGAKWTIRLRGIASNALFSDNSGSLSASAVSITWVLLSLNGSILFTTGVESGLLTPPWAAPKFAANVFMRGDPDQTVSNLDQVGGTAVGVQANATWFFLNTDAANPHSVQLGLSAVLEFEAPGSAE